MQTTPSVYLQQATVQNFTRVEQCWALLQCYSVVGVLRSVYCVATVLDLIAVFSFVQIQWRESSQSPASSGWKGKLWKWKYILKAANANLLGKTDIKRCVFGKEARKVLWKLDLCKYQGGPSRPWDLVILFLLGLPPFSTLAIILPAIQIILVVDQAIGQ